MKFAKAKLALFAALVLFAITARTADDVFVINGIELINARRISLATVLSHMPVSVGDRLTPEVAKNCIRSLYNTGFFKDVSLSRSGNKLLVTVKERPAIATIKYDGNSKLKDENIDEIFESINLVAGAIFNDQVLDSMQKELERAYYSYGRYGVKLNTKITPLPRNRVDIDIKIQEGIPSKIKRINIVGNESFPDGDILSELEQGIPAWYQFFSSKDQYSKAKFYDDTKVVESYYTSRGYINFSLDSVQVTISPDKKDIYITMNVTEGEKYTVADVSVTGDTVLDKGLLLELAKRVNVSGEYYSSTKTTDTIEYIENKLGGIGYAFANVELNTDKNDDKKTVDLNFVVNSGKRVYVRRVVFEGNEKAKDLVYRRELRQLEGAWYSKSLVERSKTRLERLPFVEEVKVDTPTVVETDDQVDVLYQIKERLAGSFNAGVGYSDYYGTSFNLSMQHSNLFGTGNAVSISASKSDVLDVFSIVYQDPYATDDGVSRSYSFAYSEYNTADTAQISYLANKISAGMSYQIPISEFSSFQIGATLSSTDIVHTVDSDIVAINDFIDTYGNQFDQLTVPFGYVFDTRNRTIFPDKGIRQSFGVSYDVAGSDLTYHKIRHNADYYWPSLFGTTLHIRHEIAYGAGRDNLKELPFYEKFSGGGNGSVRGFETRSLGPKALRLTSLGSVYTSDVTLGGDLLTEGSLEFIIKPFAKAAGTTRLIVFYDFGNAFATRRDFDTDELRTSVGISLKWLAPIGAMSFSYAEPINRQRAVPANGIEGDPAQFGIPADRVKRFQFDVGGSF
ncbi:MAG: outer membrane protein assembly factor BamA [Gammaproteobacteria bacterium]|nr:outer membrane protein assembly factor BamA [Gammaproteobacteria bacterium]